MSDDGSRERLTRLSAQLDRARAERARSSPSGGARGGYSGSALGFGFRVGLELVVALGVALGIGWALDRWFGTRPWGMVVLFFLGVGVGMVNVYRAVAGLGMKVGYRPTGTPAPGAPAARAENDDED